MLKGFKDFLFRGNVVDLAVAVVIGAAFGSIVNSLVADIITPFIGAVGGSPDFSSLSLTINGSKLMIGNFLNALISFIMISSVIYFLIVLPMNKITAKSKKAADSAPAEKVCSDCLSLIPVKAKRCKYCTSVQK